MPDPDSDDDSEGEGAILRIELLMRNIKSSYAVIWKDHMLRIQS
jgi:hypothetical protein